MARLTFKSTHTAGASDQGNVVTLQADYDWHAEGIDRHGSPPVSIDALRPDVAVLLRSMVVI